MRHDVRKRTVELRRMRPPFDRCIYESARADPTMQSRDRARNDLGPIDLTWELVVAGCWRCDFAMKALSLQPATRKALSVRLASKLANSSRDPTCIATLLQVYRRSRTTPSRLA